MVKKFFGFFFLLALDVAQAPKKTDLVVVICDSIVSYLGYYNILYIRLPLKNSVEKFCLAKNVAGQLALYSLPSGTTSSVCQFIWKSTLYKDEQHSLYASHLFYQPVWTPSLPVDLIYH